MLLILPIGFILISCDGNRNGPSVRDLNIAGFSTQLVNIGERATYSFRINSDEVILDEFNIYWDFGDGVFETGLIEVQHDFDFGSSFNIKLSISDASDDFLAFSEVITTQVTNIAADLNVEYQTIRGFGGFGGKNVYWSNGPFYDEEFIETLIHDLGLTILRDHIPTGFEPENDNDDPYSLNFNAFNITEDLPGQEAPLTYHIDYLKAMKAAGLKKLIVSIWSPPFWMKHNNHWGNGTTDQNSAPPYNVNPDNTSNQLQVEYYEEFAEYCVAYINYIKQETNLDVYALSVQNEPRFSQYYASCVYSFEALRDLIKVVGKRFEDEGIITKLFAPEDVASLFHITGYIQSILDDPIANAYTNIIATHNYRLDGINAGDQGPENWATTYELANSHGKELWMSETSGFENNWVGSMNLAKSMFNALNYGHISAWVYWQMSNTTDETFINSATGEKSGKYYVAKHYYKYIRPGFIMVESSAESAGVDVLAFKNPENNKLVYILINRENEIALVSTEELNGSSFQLFSTEENNYFEDIGIVEAGQPVVLPPWSIHTLIEQ